jgi:hypothetical protein
MANDRRPEGDYMGEIVSDSKEAQNLKEVRLLSKITPEYRLEFINGAVCNVSARGEIVCDFHFESKDRPTEQLLKVTEDGMIIESIFQETGTYTREVKYGIVMNASFARDLVILLNGKITEAEDAIKARAERDPRK